ncbi:MAG: riboflavin synthase [Chromatiales bacterium]|nr:MAG: riboflavin synthase [Chromatiales bacterium]
MFTGIVQALGEIQAIEEHGGDRRLVIGAGGLHLGGAGLGDSIAVNGVCLTAVDIEASRFAADVSRESLDLTTLGAAEVGQPVNLEPALTLSTPLGGHLVSGHVDGVGQLVSRHPEARSTRMVFEVPAELSRYVARKGSIAIDGTSLTVNEVEDCRFGVNIVPHTLERTIMGDYEPGSRVNIEVDLVARYLERLLPPAD